MMKWADRTLIIPLLAGAAFAFYVSPVNASTTVWDWSGTCNSGCALGATVNGVFTLDGDNTPIDAFTIDQLISISFDSPQLANFSGAGWTNVTHNTTGPYPYTDPRLFLWNYDFDIQELRLGKCPPQYHLNTDCPQSAAEGRIER
jgi:hypothetical protein